MFTKSGFHGIEYTNGFPPQGNSSSVMAHGAHIGYGNDIYLRHTAVLCGIFSVMWNNDAQSAKMVVEISKLKEFRYVMANGVVNTLWPNGAILRYRSGSTLAQVIAYCLTAPKHYLKHCWLTIGAVLWHSFQFHKRYLSHEWLNQFENDLFKISFASHSGHWVKTVFAGNSFSLCAWACAGTMITKSVPPICTGPAYTSGIG